MRVRMSDSPAFACSTRMAGGELGREARQPPPHGDHVSSRLAGHPPGPAPTGGANSWIPKRAHFAFIW